MRKKITLALLSLLLVPLAMMAQNVTVHPGNGSMLPAAKQDGATDTFYGWGGFATWKHEQLSLTLTTGDSDNNTGTDDDGQLAKPANDIFESAADDSGTKYLQLGKGKSMSTYLTFSLPKGYRFTGYTITFHRISEPNGATSSVDETGRQISFGETDDAFSYTSTINTTEEKITTYRGDIDQGTTTKYTIGRTSQTDTDMENLLYFKLDAEGTNRAYIQFDHIELYFTAEENYTPMITVPGVTEQSAVDIPFTTSKMDYGVLSRTDAVGNPVAAPNGRISYNGTIHDMNANLTLYENGSVRSVTAAQNDFDGTAGYMVDYKSGSISSEGDYFKLDASKHGQKDKPISETGATYDGEVIYFIESPIWATNSALGEDAHKNPIGYRITGASFDLKGSDESIPATFRIQHRGSDGNTYGLNSYEGTRIRYSQTLNYQTVWSIDEEGYIYYGTGNSKTYLALYNYNNQEINFQVTTTKPSADVNTFAIVDNGGIKQIRLKNKDYENYYIGFYEYEDWWGNIQSRAYLTADENDRAFYTEITPASEGGAIDQYTFLIYDKTGTKVAKRQVVNGSDIHNFSIDGLNNDAVKIGVIGTGYINGKVTMQALDPYIDHMDIVCQEQGGNGGKLTQQFNATDFSVRGGAFTFYVPEDFKAPAKFSFENLYSSYGDNTYYNETSSTNHARYSFVWSPYFQWIAEHGKNVYYTDPDHPYTDKIHTAKPGKVPFTFNNAKTVTANGGEFEENPFNPGKYGESNFDDFIFETNEMGTNPATVKTAYLFTCDETRYNIAPTTATQHTAYAYYQMKIDMQKKDYRPNLEWTKVYAKDNTFYSANNAYKTDAMWGLTVTTEPVTDDQGTHSGYVTVSKLLDVIEKGLPEVPAQGTEPAKPAVQGLDSTGENAPKSMSQILYIDGSNLMSIVENQTVSGTGESATTTSHTVDELMTGLAANALVYLPYGSKPSNDNFAYNTIAQYTEGNNNNPVTPSFRGASNIVLTDKNPFYAKYGIQVDAAKSAKYTRQITKSTYTDETYATVILPFEIALVNGQHADDYGTLEFLQMNENNATADDYNYMGKTIFFSKTNAEKVEANTPYALHVVENKGEDGVFTVNQKGAVIIATPAEAKNDNSLFSATEITAKGNLTDKDGNSSSYTFSHKGSFSGYRIPKKSPKTFYFANGGFYSSVELKDAYKTVDLLPFRSVYEVTSDGSAKVGFLRFVEGENETSGIDVFKAASAEVDMNAPVYDLQGRMVAPSYREAKGLQNGLYVVNGVKIIVK